MRVLTKIGISAVAVLVITATSCAMLGRTGDSLSGGERIGEVTTNFHWVTPNDKIIVEAFDDALVRGSTCYISRATTGGFWYLLGMNEDPSDAAIDCVERPPVVTSGDPECKPDGSRLQYDYKKLLAENGEKVVKHHTSIFFKTMQVRRFVDAKRCNVVYVTNSDTLLGGSHKNSVSAISLR